MFAGDNFMTMCHFTCTWVCSLRTFYDSKLYYMFKELRIILREYVILHVHGSVRSGQFTTVKFIICLKSCLQGTILRQCVILPVHESVRCGQCIDSWRQYMTLYQRYSVLIILYLYFIFGCIHLMIRSYLTSILWLYT